MIVTHLSEIGFHEDLQQSQQATIQNQKTQEIVLKTSKKIKILIEATKKLKLAFDEVVEKKVETENYKEECENEIRMLKQMIMELKAALKTPGMSKTSSQDERGFLNQALVPQNSSKGNLIYSDQNLSKEGDEENLSELFAKSKLQEGVFGDQEEDKDFFHEKNYEGEEEDLENGFGYDKDLDFNEPMSTDWGIGIVPEVGRASLETTERHRTKEGEERRLSEEKNERSSTIEIYDSYPAHYTRDYAKEDDLTDYDRDTFIDLGGRRGDQRHPHNLVAESSLGASLTEAFQEHIDFTEKKRTQHTSPSYSEKGEQEIGKIEEHQAELVQKLKQHTSPLKGLDESSKQLKHILENFQGREEDSGIKSQLEQAFQKINDSNRKLQSELKMRDMKLQNLEKMLHLRAREKKMNSPLKNNQLQSLNSSPNKIRAVKINLSERASPQKLESEGGRKMDKKYIQTLEIERLEIENRWKKERIKVRELKRELKILQSNYGNYQLTFRH